MGGSDSDGGAARGRFLEGRVCVRACGRVERTEVGKGGAVWEGPGAAAAMLCSVVGEGGTGGSGSPQVSVREGRKFGGEETPVGGSRRQDGRAGAGDVISAFGFRPNEAEAGNKNGRLLWSSVRDGQGPAEFGECQELNRLEYLSIKISGVPGKWYKGH